VSLADAIAPGALTGELGTGTDTVIVGPGAFVTYVVATSPSFAGETVGVWTRRSSGTWQHTASTRIGPDGWARYVLPVRAWTAIQARLPATAAHAAAVSHGRIATVDPTGRTIVSLSCDETGSWGPGTIAARAVGVHVGSTIRLSVCASAGRTWTVGDVDRGAVGISSRVASVTTRTQIFDLTILRPGSRAVRLIERVGGAHPGPERSLLLLLEAAALPLRVARDLPITPAVPCGPSGSCQVRADVYAPRGPGPWPVVVLLRGGPGGLGARAVYAAFAARLASEGLLVYNADYRDAPVSGGTYPRAFDDVACAVRVARQTAAQYGGETKAVTLVGHSLGAYVGSMVALGANAFDSSCRASGNGVPNVFVGLSGPYLLDEPNLSG
jgi:alpha/beta hydrolase fold